MLIRYTCILLLLLSAALALWSCGEGKLGKDYGRQQKDSSRIQATLDSLYDLQFSNPDSSFIRMKPAGAEARRLGLYRVVFNYYKYAVSNRVLLAGDTASGRALAQEAMHTAEQTGDSLHLGDAALCMGMLYGSMEITDSSSFYFRRAAQYLECGRDRSGLLDAWHNLAEMTRIQGDYPAAEKYLLKNVNATRNRKGEERALAIEYASLHEVEDALGRVELAKAYLDSSALLYAQAGMPNEPSLLRMKGSYALAQCNPDSALLYYDAALDAFLATDDSMSAGIACLNKARAFAAKGAADSVADNVRKMEALTMPDALPMTSRRDYYVLQLALPPTHLSAERRSRLSAEYITLQESFIQKNSQLIGTQYLHEMEQAAKDKTILQQQVRNAEKDKELSLLAIGIVVLIGACLFTYFYWRKKRALQAEKLARLESQQAIEMLTTRMNAQLEERSRIAHELHDDLGATLTSISMATELLKRKHELADSREVSIISHSSASLVDKMNEIVWSLNTGNDTVQSLVAYIRKFAGAFLEQAGIELEANIPQDIAETPLPGYIRRNLYLTVKEALHNIVKHSHASKVVLQVWLTATEIAIDVSDNGIGLQAERDHLPGNGLRNMKAALKAIGGAIFWTAGGGTHIHITSPISA